MIDSKVRALREERVCITSCYNNQSFPEYNHNPRSYFDYTKLEKTPYFLWT